ncbi:thiosulfate dehydrogenase [Thalassobacillus cyri]|uniref:Thiosulfate dehydrogenase n=1 Tax=Thalassobacillus cyri TaxID=571932 RepID=A0A1H3W3J2_9BACI|nr:hypothetical protein [Thalassobacillus cyri]SDZ81705.1 thiosulfate dehydrogenase [Thalassobacillus cyri]
MIISACSNNQESNEEKDDQSEEAPRETTQEVVNDPPSLDDLEDSPEAEYIRYGEKLMKETNTVMADYVGNELSCTSCHAEGGLSDASSFVGVTTQFPQYRKREGVVFTIED